MDTYSHLANSARSIVDLTNSERISYIYRDHLIKFDQFNYVTSELDRLFHYPRQIRMPCMLLMGPTGVGKTKAVSAFMRRYRPDAQSQIGGFINPHPVVIMQMPAEPTQQEFLLKMLRAVNAPVTSAMKVSDLERMLVSILRDVGTRIIIIDEFHNLNSSTARQRQIVINTIKNLTNDTSIPIVAVGTSAAQLTIKYDDQMSHRFRPVEMQPFKPGKSLDEFLRTVVAHLPLRQRSNIDTREFKKRLLDLTGGITVNLLRLLSDSAALAIQTGAESLTLDSLSLVPAPLLSIPRQRKEPPFTSA